MSKKYILLILVVVGLFSQQPAFSQKINVLKSENLNLIYFGKRYDYLLPHVALTYHNSMQFHSRFWGYNDTTTYIILNDFQDMGHGGAIAMPFSQVQLGIQPYSFAFSIIPSNERFQWLFNHELTHIVMADKPSKKDNIYRNIFHGKIRRSQEYPLSALWSYLTTPRWYAPRWFHEGIACFMETWMSGGLGRTMGTYDEMYFRSIVNEKLPLYSLVGLETEGTTVDFQVGANSYLYGTRFVSYLALKYGIDNLKEFYNRTDQSNAFYGNQFKKIYGRSIKDEWENWTKWENKFQQNNIDLIKEYPLTNFKAITKYPLGNVSKMAYNPNTKKIYAAINHPGIISQIAEIDINSGKIRKLANLDSPDLYYSTSLTYSAKKEKIYISEQNHKYRSLVEIDVKTGKKRTVNKITRTGDLVINPMDNSIWGVQHDNGNAILVKIPEPYNKVIPMFTAPFGQAIFDIDISHKTNKLIASLSGVKGEQSLILFDLNKLEQGVLQYKTILKLEDNTLTQFKFSINDSSLIGTSYYTGVSNIWKIDTKGENFELLSNTETGMFMPVQIAKDSLLVLKFQRDGMIPGIIHTTVLKDANSINYIGNEIHKHHKQVEEWSLPAASLLADSLEESVTSKYIPLKEMKLANAYPDIAGFKNTVAVGYRVNWRDPIGISNIDLFLAVSPWSQYENRQKIHAMFKWRLWNWKFLANFNPTHFYDLFGPTKRSRAGYSIGVEHKKNNSIKAPLKKYYQFGAYTYGDLEVLPQYQNIESPIKSFQAATAEYGISKLRKSLGGIEYEKGFDWNINSTTYLAKGELFPSIISNQSIGWLIPGVRNSSFWIRNSIGQSLGNKESGMSNFYFGGFRNNYVDWQPSEQYRSTLAFPGANIDEIQAHNFIKTMGELNLRPLRLRNFGTSWLYPTYIKSSIFGTHLMTNFDNTNNLNHYFNLGAQIDIQLVLFSYFKTTWSVGYAQKMIASENGTGQWMVSIKLLGN